MRLIDSALTSIREYDPAMPAIENIPTTAATTNIVTYRIGIPTRSTTPSSPCVT